MSVYARGDLESCGAIALSPKKERLLLPDFPWKVEDPKESQRIEHARRITRVRPHTAQETCLGNSRLVAGIFDLRMQCADSQK